mmetsp:Transcript_47372/g.90437  ORF Transcript_47372/g.90437 Transcript_47372/m.90437 type:complete len:392 (-) Transcript_47372:1762-2937(-)
MGGSMHPAVGARSAWRAGEGVALRRRGGSGGGGALGGRGRRQAQAALLGHVLQARRVRPPHRARHRAHRHSPRTVHAEGLGFAARRLGGAGGGGGLVVQLKQHRLRGKQALQVAVGGVEHVRRAVQAQERALADDESVGSNHGRLRLRPRAVAGNLLLLLLQLAQPSSTNGGPLSHAHAQRRDAASANPLSGLKGKADLLHGHVAALHRAQRGARLHLDFDVAAAQSAPWIHSLRLICLSGRPQRSLRPRRLFAGHCHGAVAQHLHLRGLLVQGAQRPGHDVPNLRERQPIARPALQHRGGHLQHAQGLLPQHRQLAAQHLDVLPDVQGRYVHELLVAEGLCRLGPVQPLKVHAVNHLREAVAVVNGNQLQLLVLLEGEVLYCAQAMLPAD